MLTRQGSMRSEALVFLGLSLAFGGGIALVSPVAGLLALAGMLLLSGLHLWVLYRRERALQQLSRQLYGILQGTQTLQLDEYREGEQAVLRCELQKLLLQLSAAEKASLEEKNRLADALADISHQLRTPMTSIELICAMLERPGLDESRRIELSRRLSDLSFRMSWLIESLLKLSRFDAGVITLQKQPVALSSLLFSAAEPLSAVIELRQQKLTLPQDAGLFAECDPVWTAEALGNLLKNASEHCPPGGEIRVAAERSAVYTQITVHDDGPGIDPRDLPHLFERFYRGSQASKGSFGIGLALARQILSQQGGTLTAANHPKGGALFTLRLYDTTI